MIAHISRLISFILVGLFFCGCTTSEPKPSSAGVILVSPKTEIRNNAVSLLYDLLGNEKNVSKILIIKHSSKELGRLVKTISKTTGNFQKQLESLSTNDPTLNLHSMELPPGERAARAAVAKTKEHELLFSSGKEFEFNLLMTQAEALSYGNHLAKVAAEHSASPEEIEKFSTMNRILKNLYDQVILQIHSVTSS